jgi:hypothetical protein
MPPVVRIGWLGAGLLLASCTQTQTPSAVEGTSAAATFRVSSISELRTRIDKANPGDVIILANGTYTTTSDTEVTRKGSASAPILITAETIGGVELRGTHGITIGDGAAFVQIRGFKFRHAASTLSMPSSSNHCRYTRNVFEETGTGSYLSASGNDHEIDHNIFQNKSTEGQMLSIQGPGGSGMAQRTWVHHNLFRNFTNGGGNNFETVRVGLSGRSLTDAHSLFEHNLFTDCNGENELISNKSSANTYRFNTIRDSKASLTLRHGNNCLVYGNHLINTDGIRFFGDGHKIYRNHLVGNSPAIQIGNGDGEVADGDKLTSHDRPDDVEVSFNTLVDNESNFEMTGRTGGLGATKLLVANNIVQGGGAAASIRGPLSGETWRGNILFQSSAGDMPASGFRTVDPKLISDSRGHHLSATSPAVNAAMGAHPSPALDIDGQDVGNGRDVGADEVAAGPVIARILTPADVGPDADDASSGNGTPTPPDPPAQPDPPPSPDPGGGGAIAFEAESVEVTNSGTGTTVEVDPHTSGGLWVSLAAENAGSWMELTTPTIPAGTYQLSLAWKGHDTRGVANIRVDDVVVGESLDQFTEEETFNTTAIGPVTFAAAGTHLIRLKVAGQRAASKGFILSADKLTFTPQ